MVNRLYNKQVSPKGYFLGGRVKKKKETAKEKKQRADERNKVQENLREKILPKQKKKRLEELKEMLK